MLGVPAGRRDAEAARSRGLVERGEQKEAILTATGIERAERVVRKHRIIERWLTDFMGYTAAEAHVHADELGDTFSADMVERIQAKLGNPDRCLHGWPSTRSSSRPRTRSWRRSPTSRRGAKRRSCVSPSMTASSCTGSTTRASRRGRASSSASGSRRSPSSGCCSEPTASARSARRPLPACMRAPHSRPTAPGYSRAPPLPRVQARDRLDRDHRVDAGRGREGRAVGDDEVAARPRSPRRDRPQRSQARRPSGRSP